ncbi:MAG TPA: sugar ABC transporter permease [Anaerolineales bacterium]|nr:sugar ABC transporter permease [Anaerolineales bacterium]
MAGPSIRKVVRQQEAAPVPKVMKQGKVVPWLYLAPAILIMFLFIVYPMVNTVRLSFLNKDGTASAATTCAAGKPCWGVFENYHYALTAELDTSSPEAIWNSFWSSSYGNTLKWIIFMTAFTVGIGLAFAMLADRVRYEALSKAIIFMPMAISFVGAGVIWKFVYNYGSSGVQIGLLNAMLVALGRQPVAFVATPGWNTASLIVVGIWIWTGFCMTILSAAIKSVPDEIIEAARVDGAREWTIFWAVIVPIIAPTIVVVITTMVINTLKVFDIVYVMTGGNFGTDVIANRMYTEMYKNFNVGRGTAIAVILVVAILPFVYFNIKRFIAQEAIR